MQLMKRPECITLKSSIGEEVENPAASVPRSMVLAVIINGVLAFGWIIALLFSLATLELR